jgi:biopolymer transport protein ExbD
MELVAPRKSGGMIRAIVTGVAMLVVLAFIIGLMYTLTRFSQALEAKRADATAEPPAAAIAAPGDEAPSLVIRVAPGGAFSVGGDPCTLEQLQARLAAAAQEDPKRAVMIRAAASTPLEDVAQVMRLCVRHDLRVILETQDRP